MEKKRNIVEWAMHYRQIVILLTCVLVAFGIFGLMNVNKNEFPDFTIRQGVVVAVYPGASAQEVENQLTKPLEDYIFTYKEVKKSKTKSYSRNGMSIVQVELNDNVNNKDEFWSKFKHGIDQFKTSLPSGVLAVVVNDDFGDTSALLITMESKDKTYRELKDYMDQLQDNLRTIDDVGRMTVTGMQKEQISIYLDYDRLSNYGISPTTLGLTLKAKGFQTTAGTLKGDGMDKPIYVSPSLNAVHDVEETIVFSDIQGNVVRLKDVARVVREYPQPTSYITNNGTKCILLSIELKKGGSITTMGDEVKKAIADFQTCSLPQDVKMFTITDQSQVVGDSIISFLKELLIAIVAVIIVVLLLMPMRVALVAASTIPITIFISLGVFYAFGVELNTVTLAALIVTLGMIVDNSIVIIDNYVDLLGQGMSRWNASIKSATHFFKSIFTATLAISVTFFPFLFTMKGTFHDFVQWFPWSMAIILFISLLVAELVVPFMQFFFIRKPMAHKKGFNFLDFIQKWYDRLIDFCFRHPLGTLATGVASVIAAVIVIANLPMRMMPAAERNQFAVEIYLPSGTSLDKTAIVADSLEHILRKDPRVVSIASFKGTSSPRFQTSYAPLFGGPNYAQFIVNTTSPKATLEVLAKYRQKYQNAFPAAYIKFKELEYGDFANPIEVRISGSDWNKLKQASDTITKIFRNDPNLELVRSDVNEPLPVMNVKLDEQENSQMGITNIGVEIGLASRYNSDGLTVGTVWQGDYDMNVRLKGRNADNATPEDLKSELIPVRGGLTNAPLRQIADVKPAWQDAQIAHRNGIRTITVMSEVTNGVNVTDYTKILQKKIRDLKLDGASISWGGEADSNAETLPSLVGGLTISVFIIFMLMLFHFKNLSTAMLLLFSLLLTFFGMSMGIFIPGGDFTLTCFLGLVSLMGILVRNAIIMYDYAEELRETEHLDAKEAIMLSAKRRMRPIFLTSAAASMGVLPMIMSGSGLWAPMGNVIFYGTIITMFFILTVLPIAYWRLEAKSTEKRLKNSSIENL